MMTRLPLVSLAAFLVSTVIAAATVYHVNAINDGDANDGTSPERAWRSLTPVNGRTFQPGDSILFRSGGQWTGQFRNHRLRANAPCRARGKVIPGNGGRDLPLPAGSPPDLGVLQSAPP